VALQTLHDAFAQSRRQAPDLPCLAESALGGGRIWTYEQAGRVVDELVDLYAGRGWSRGHRVALAVGNHPRHFFHFLALNRLGVSIVPLNPDYRSAEIRHALGLTGAGMAICHRDRQPLLLEAIAADDALAGTAVVSIDDLAGGMPAAPRAPGAGGDPLAAEAAILFTSGTSGRPKGCVLSNEYVLGAGAWYRDMGGLLSWREAEDRLLNPLPVFHMNCSMVSFPATCLTRNCLIIPDRFHASTWWEDCVKSQATAIHYLGVMPPVLFKQERGDWERRHHIRFGLGAGCDPTLHGPFEERFGFPLVEVWGMTETGRFLGNHHDPRQTHTRAFGREQPPLEVRVVDAQDEPVAVDAVGELLVRAQGDDPRRGFFSAYLHDEEATEKAWRGGWFHTGDVVRQDATGMLYFVDRKKDMVRRSGENISSAEVEAVLAIHPAVLRVAIVPVPDALRDEEVMAVVVPAPGAQPDEATASALVSHCLRELAYYKAPGWVLFRVELPTTPTNKIQKNLIFAPGGDRTEGAWDCRPMKKRS
jgi:acyl-CoA synthetase (AMP-forming)/AMP-acid ligase II